MCGHRTYQIDTLNTTFIHEKFEQRSVLYISLGFQPSMGWTGAHNNDVNTVFRWLLIVIIMLLLLCHVMQLLRLMIAWLQWQMYVCLHTEIVRANNGTHKRCLYIHGNSIVYPAIFAVHTKQYTLFKLCCVLLWLICPYSSGLLHWRWVIIGLANWPEAPWRISLCINHLNP